MDFSRNWNPPFKASGRNIALLRGIVESFEGLIYVSSGDYRIEYANDKLIRLKGADIAARICFKALHDRESPCPFCVKDQVNLGRTVSFEIQNPRDGRWYRSVNTPIDSGPQRRSHLSLITDVHDRKLAELALRENAEQLRKENILLKSNMQQRHKFGGLVGKSASMQAVYDQILSAAASDATVIIYGEPGTGKELVAHAVHEMSRRRPGRLVPVHCGAIPENLVESEFFGYRKGAFSGADAEKPGYIDHADGGTLFLDEIGEISLNMQVKLLRAIDGGGYTPVGGREVKQSDFRIIAATNRNLMDLIEKGAMREDFFYRIHILPIHLPPLRQRREDIPLLVDHFLLLHRGKQNIPPVTGSALEQLIHHHWPGNVRELQNVILRYCALKKIDLNIVEPFGASAGMAAPADGGRPGEGTLRGRIDILVREAIRNCLEKNRWNRSQAARQLGIDRKTLIAKIKQYEIE